MSGIYCPIKVLARRFIYLHNNAARDHDIISCFWGHLRKYNFADVAIRVATRRVVLKLDLGKNGITASRVVIHSLRVEGAMALFFQSQP